MGARWISYLRKRELEAILKEFSLDTTGSVEEMRSRLAAFNNREDHVLDIAERLQECEGEILAALNERKQRTPSPHPPGPTRLQVPALGGRCTGDGTTDPITFIQQLQERATAYEVNVKRMPQAIPGLLTDTAKHWFRTSQLLGESWMNFKKAFLDFFLPPRYFQRLEDEIRTRYQRQGETFKQFLKSIGLMMHPAGYNPE
ncbi:hypothetical protein KR054_000357, partial [Drosophila jambulina]